MMTSIVLMLHIYTAILGGLVAKKQDIQILSPTVGVFIKHIFTYHFCADLIFI